MRRHYGALFEGMPQLHAEIVTRLVHGHYVIALDRVTGHARLQASNSRSAVSMNSLSGGFAP